MQTVLHIAAGSFLKKEAISVGYETSQKIHNALRWLIQKQAYKQNGQTIFGMECTL